MMDIFFGLLFSTLVIPAYTYESSQYSSTVSIMNLLKNQEDVIKKLQQYIDNHKQSNNVKLEHINRYIGSYKEMVATEELTKEILYHPISGYHFFKHVVSEWADLKEKLEHDPPFVDLMLDITMYRLTKGFPGNNDLFNIAASIGRMQYMYQVPIQDLIQGRVSLNSSGKEVYMSRKGLDSWDCLLIGTSTLNKNYMKPAFKWLHLAQLLVEKDNKASLDNLSRELLEARKYSSFQRTSNVEEQMGRLCRGEHHKDTSSESFLKCKYFTNEDPFLFIAPFKMEVFSMSPPIVGFHDFLSNYEIERMKEIASPHLISSVVMQDEDGGASFQRTSQQYWLGNTEDPRLTSGISRRIEQATGLYTEIGKPDYPWIAESYQVLNYGIGGLYLSHQDYYHPMHAEDSWYKNGGNRIATFMIYLNDVEIGGATVFPKVDVALWPKKGFAAFWYNLLKSGEPDPDTEHGGCPVLYGSKWISNKWIHEKHQDGKLCGLEKKNVHEM